MPYYLVGVLALGVAAQWLAWRLRLPSILLLLGFGFGAAWLVSELYNVDIRGQIDDKLLFPIISLSVAVILFEGGLTLRLSELRAAGGVVLRLVTFGALITWVCTGLMAYGLLDFDPRIAALIGAILVVTGPTVIGPLLRHVRPARKIGSIVKWEGIVIDPIGAVLAVLVFTAVLNGDDGGLAAAAQSLLMTIAVGPASVFLATIGSELNTGERVFLAALAPRGIVAAAVSSVFALEVLHHAPADIAAEAEQLVPLTFLVIVGTVTVYGLTAAPLARWLGLADVKAQGILFAGADALSYYTSLTPLTKETRGTLIGQRHFGL